MSTTTEIRHAMEIMGWLPKPYDPGRHGPEITLSEMIERHHVYHAVRVIMLVSIHMIVNSAETKANVRTLWKAAKQAERMLAEERFDPLFRKPDIGAWVLPVLFGLLVVLFLVIWWFDLPVRFYRATAVLVRGAL